MNRERAAYLPYGQFAPRPVGRNFSNPSITNAHQEILEGRKVAFNKGSGNAEAAVALRAMLRSSVLLTCEVDVECVNLFLYLFFTFKTEIETTGVDKPILQTGASNNESLLQSSAIKRKRDDDDDDFSHDEVRLWEDGFKARYYESKFAVKPTDEAFRSKVALEYVRGLCWVLQYYYQVNCCSDNC